MTQLNYGRDVQGFNADAPEQSSNKYSATLGASSAQSITVPSTFKKWIAFFSYEKPALNVWVSINGTAEVPAGATFAATTSTLNPEKLTVYAGDVISVITASANTDVGVSLYVAP